MAILDATLAANASTPNADPDVTAKIVHARELFEKVAEEDALKNRSGHLALLELESRASAHGVSTGKLYSI